LRNVSDDRADSAFPIAKLIQNRKIRNTQCYMIKVDDKAKFRANCFSKVGRLFLDVRLQNVVKDIKGLA
jgi:hypothetical protein